MRLGGLSVLLLLSACTVGPDYQTPQLSLPTAWKSDKLETAETTADNWWEELNDPVLNDLIVRAFANNKDLKIAEGRVREARANRLGALSPLFPEINATGTASRKNQGFLSGNKPITLYETGFDAMWEIDLFGGKRRELEAASALFSASEAERGEVIISLVAEVARNYIEVRSAQNRLAITTRTMESQKSLVDLVRSRRDAGLTSDLETSQAEAEYLTVSSRIPVINTELEAAKNRLSYLTGELPGTVDPLVAEVKPVPVLASAIVLSTPATSIAMRPDVHAAERELASTTALQGAAISNWYPRVSISGMFGLQNTSILPSDNVWNLAGNVAMPVFYFGRIRSLVDASDARQMQAEAAYEKAVLAALEEVETGLVRYLNEEARRETLQKAADSNRQAVTLSEERYHKGITSFKDVLDAQRALFESETMLALSQASVSQNAIALYKALGGAITPPEAATPSAPPAP